jgi:signal transduction histidine kinase
VNVVTQFRTERGYDRDLRFHAMFEEAAIGMAICQLDGRILQANPALSRMLGYSREELAATHSSELCAELHGELGGGLVPARGPQNSSGTLSSENISLNKRRLGEMMRGEREMFEIEKRFRRKDGSELWGHLTVSFGHNRRRQPGFLIATLADTSERKRLQEQLREAEKMQAIGRMAGNIAHDFNNLLTGILLYCDLLSAGLEKGDLECLKTDRSTDRLMERSLERSIDRSINRLKPNGSEPGRWESGAVERSDLRHHLEEVRRAAEQGAALTQQLLAIGRKQGAEPQPSLINEVVASTKNLLQRLVGEQIELIVMLDSDAGRVLTDPAKLRQILMNLVLNARDAMPNGGKIGLITRAAELIATEPGVAQRVVSLAVRDNGCGMDAETQARLFEPFFTTKKPGEGTGLGLATVQRIVSEAGGRISVESAPGHGTCIEVFFPAVEPPAAKALSF